MAVLTDTDGMQREAEERVRQMREHTQRLVGRFEPRTEESLREQEREMHNERLPGRREKAGQKEGGGLGELDGERLLLLLILVYLVL